MVNEPNNFALPSQVFCTIHSHLDIVAALLFPLPPTHHQNGTLLATETSKGLTDPIASILQSRGIESKKLGGGVYI